MVREHTLTTALTSWVVPLNSLSCLLLVVAWKDSGGAQKPHLSGFFTNVGLPHSKLTRRMIIWAHCTLRSFWNAIQGFWNITLGFYI